MLKKVLVVVLALVLLALPLAIRWFYFYEGRYRPGEVNRPDLDQIKEPVPETEPFVDRYTAAAPGVVLVDLAHDNRVQMAELNVLQARLAARGQRLESVTAAGDLSGSDASGTGLVQQLRYAKALLVISPGADWTPSEIQAVEEFVRKGGRLLLVTDPTRFEILFDEWGDFVGLDYDAIHVNDLAAQFGLVFQADYLYNTTENEGNYRNIKLTDFATHDLTQGLDQVVFYAAHSIVSEEPTLITAGGETRSSNSERAGELAVAVLAADGAVLALGDLTFMIEPYNAVYDNDRFVANVADFLSSAQRQYDLADFPFFFDDQVDLIYTGDPLLNGDLLGAGSTLQALFADRGGVLAVREEEDNTRDTLFFGLYEQAEEVEHYLADAQVTLLISPTETIEEEPEAAPELLPKATPSPVPMPALTTPLTVTPALELAVTTEISPTAENRLEIEPLGAMVLPGTSLLLLQTYGDRQVLVVLADTETGLEKTIERLTRGDLEGCLLRDLPTVLALCPTGEAKAKDSSGGWEKPKPLPPPPTPTPAVTETIRPPEPAGEVEGSIIIVALDEGRGRYDSLTGAEDYTAILKDRYDVTVWSTAQDGVPDISDLLEHDLVIWTAGDFEDAFGDQESGMLFALVLEGTPVIVSGAYVGDADTKAVQKDIQVKDAGHPLAKGFDVGKVLDFVAAPSGSEYETNVIEDLGEDEGAVVFVRGPASEAAGNPSVFVLEEEFSGVRIVFIGFPIYLLPEAPKSQLVLNTVSWLLSP